jgi:hypothetical protein
MLSKVPLLHASTALPLVVALKPLWRVIGVLHLLRLNWDCLKFTWEFFQVGVTKTLEYSIQEQTIYFAVTM